LTRRVDSFPDKRCVLTRGYDAIADLKVVVSS